MDTTQAVEALRRALPAAHFAQPGSSDYDGLNHVYQSGLCSDITPACIVQPSTTDDVSTFVKTIKPFALSGKAPFAIVGGGQQPAPGCSNIQDGITLSCSDSRASMPKTAWWRLLLARAGAPSMINLENQA